jgi:signal transduction histidine kinase
MRVEDISNEAQQTKAINDLEEMTMLINDSLAIARGDAVSARREVIDIAGLLQKNIADRCNSAISFEQPPSSQMFRVRGDGVALKRLFDNIINNATQFATRVNTGLENVEENVVVYVDDDGPGIPAAERTAVFEPFYRLEQSRSRATGGSGLGLAIAGQIVDAHHGRIEIQRSPMGGARVAIFLPRAEAI